MRGLVVTTALLLALCAPARALVNKCLSYESTLGDTSLGFCAGVFPDNYIYFGNSSISQEALEGAALQSITQGNPALAQLLLLLPEGCATQLKRVACSAVFPACQTVHPRFLMSGGMLGLELVATSELVCDGIPGVQWDEFTGFCGVPIPRFPCRSECEAISELSGSAVCPPVSGLFYSQLLNLAGGVPLVDVAVQNAATLALTDKGCQELGPTPEAVCNATRFSFNLLSLLGFAPRCEGVAPPGLNPLSLDVFPVSAQVVLQSLVNDAIVAEGRTTDCGHAASPGSVLCADVQQVYQCVTPVPTTPVQRTYDVALEESACSAVLRHPANQDATLTHILALGDALRQPVVNQQQCLQYGKTERFTGVYFVPPASGVAPLVSRVDADGVEIAVDTFDETQCPNEWDAGAKFGNMLNESAPLCTSTVFPTRKGFNARDCLQLTVDESVARFPRFAPWRCQVAFREYVCGRAQMKPQLRHLCLVPDELGGCITDNSTAAALEDKFAFSFSLPRFPSQDTCQLFATECAALLPTIGVDPGCGGVVNITECSNPVLDASGVWGCSSGFNGIPAFPAASQTFADASAIGSLGLYAAGVAANGLTLDIQAPLRTDVAEPTVSAPLLGPLSASEKSALQREFCVCPRPLVVPDDPDGETLTPGTCCALPCIGSMFDQDDMLLFGKVQFALSLLGVVLCLFMLATLVTFPEKRKQYMQFWMFLCSIMISGFFLAMAARPSFNITENLCADNSTPNTLKDTGFSLNVAQSIVLHYFATALCAWWLTQAFDLFRKLVLGTRNTDASKAKYHVFCWGVPTVEAVALLSTREIGFKPPTPWSFIAGSSALEFAVFYAFVGVCFVLGGAMMVSVIYIIVRHTRRSRDLNTSSGGNKRMWNRFKLYRTPMLFVAAFILVWCDIFTFRFLNFFSEDAFREDAQAWVGCLLTNFGNGILDPAVDPLADTSLLKDAPAGQLGCGLVQPNGVNMAFLTLTFVVVMSQSIILFVVFGTPARNYTLWLEKFGCVALAEEREYSEGSFSKDTGSKGAGNSYSFQLSSTNATGSSPYGSSARNPAYFSGAAPVGSPPSAPPGLAPPHQSYY